jgi:SAM-dependent methyltransferase
MSASFGTGFHATPTGTVDASAYERFTGRWSRLFIPAVLADIAPGSRVLDVSTGTGEAASMALPIVGMSGFVVGADISPQMLLGAVDGKGKEQGGLPESDFLRFMDERHHEDWEIVLKVFDAAQSKRGEPEHDDWKFLAALHYFTVRSIGPGG